MVFFCADYTFQGITCYWHKRTACRPA